MVKTLAVLGIPVETGQQEIGPANAPDFIRGLDLINEIGKLGYDVSDLGNMDAALIVNDDKLYRSRLPKTFKENTFKTKMFVEPALNKNDVVIVLGGDRSVTTGSILAHHSVDKDICVLWVGRKPSLHTALSSETGNMNEMPLFLLISEMQEEVPWISDFHNIIPILPAKSIGFVGLHEVDNYERYVINKCGIKAMSAAEIDRLGMAAVIRETLLTINPGLTKSIHLCMNADAFDPLYGPSSADCAPGGLTFREMITIGECLSSTGKLRVMDVLECNPMLGSDKDNDITRHSIVKMILAVLGAKRPGTPFVDPSFYMWQKHNICRGIRFQ